MSTTEIPQSRVAETPVGSPAVGAAERRARTSIAFGRERGYYRVLFEAGSVDAAAFAVLAGVPEHAARAWLAEQVGAGVLRVVRGPGGHDELLLPGEFVPALLGDHGEVELAGARRLLAEHRDMLPHGLDDVRAGRHPGGLASVA